MRSERFSNSTFRLLVRYAPEEDLFRSGENYHADILCLENIRQATLFPRDMERIDIRLSSVKDTQA